MSNENTGTPGPKGDAGARGERGKVGHLSSGSWVVIIVACLVVTGLGVQMWLADRASDAEKRKDDQQRACINEWGTALVDVATIRAEGNTELRNAQTRKDKADNAVTDVFVEAFITQPRPSDEELKEHFTVALREYEAAKENLATVTGTVAITSASNPYPELDLNCKTKPK